MTLKLLRTPMPELADDVEPVARMVQIGWWHPTMRAFLPLDVPPKNPAGWKKSFVWEVAP